MKLKKFCVFDLIDTLLWVVIALLPVLLYAIYIHHSAAPISFAEFFSENLGIALSSDSVIYTAFEKIFVAGNGFFDIFENMGVALQLCVWFFFVEFLHVMLDFLLFIPKWLHEVMSKYAYGR